MRARGIPIVTVQRINDDVTLIKVKSKKIVTVQRIDGN